LGFLITRYAYNLFRPPKNLISFYQIPHHAVVSAIKKSVSQISPGIISFILCEPPSSSILEDAGLKLFAASNDVHIVSAQHGDLFGVLRSAGTMPHILVVECNWRFSANANRLSIALSAHSASIGPAAAGAVVASHQAEISGVYPIRVPDQDPLRSEG
jgi:hypothetical protein